MSRVPLRPKHPERVCWGCDRYCPVSNMGCSKDRTEHPIEVFGEEWALEAEAREEERAAAELSLAASG